MKYLILILLSIFIFISCQSSYKVDSNGFGIFHYIDTIKTSKKLNISYPQ